MTDQSQIDAMANVLRKLNDTTETAARTMVSESRANPDIGVAVQSKRTETGVTVSQYEITTTKKTVSEGLAKTFYSIVDNRSGEVLYDDLGLFETAMGVVKHLLYTGKLLNIDRIIELDTAYTGLMVETYGYKKRIARLDESSVQYDVASAKYSSSKSKLASIKMQLLKAL